MAKLNLFPRVNNSQPERYVVESASAQNILKCLWAANKPAKLWPRFTSLSLFGDSGAAHLKDALSVLTGVSFQLIQENVVNRQEAYISFLEKDPMLACISKQTDQVEYFQL